MRITSIVLVIGGLWLGQRWSHARQQQSQAQEIERPIADPYASITNIWEALNGGNLTGSGSNPNAHPALIDYTAGQACNCPGNVGVM